MSKIFYIGTDGKVYGPVFEIDVQRWYASGYFSSDVKFQIPVSGRFDPKGRLFTLGELIDLNGRALPFYFSPEKQSRENEQEETLKQLKQEMSALREVVNKLPSKDKTEGNDDICALQCQVSSLMKSHSESLQKLSDLSRKKENSPDHSSIDRKMAEINKKVEEQGRNIASMKKEISAVNSKCDRNENEMENVLEKQNETEKIYTGFEKRILELKLSEKSILETITEFEKNSSNEVKRVTGDLTKIKEDIRNVHKDSTEFATELEKAKNDLRDLIALVEEQKLQVASAMVVEKINHSSENNPDLPPWDQIVNKNDSSTASDNISEPWNHSNEHADRTGEVTNSTTIPEVKTKRKAKDWDAICRELSDDEEEDKQRENIVEGDIVGIVPKQNPHELAVTLSKAADEKSDISTSRSPILDAPPPNDVLKKILNNRPSVTQENRRRIDNFILLFRQYLKFLSTRRMNEMDKRSLGRNALDGISFELLEWRSDSPEFVPLAQALLAEFPKVCVEMELICWYCPCRLFTEINLLDHLVQPDHVARMAEEGPVAHLHAETVQRMLGKLSCLLKRTGPVTRDLPLKEKGEALFKKLAGDERLRPTREFVRTALQKYMNLACAGDSRAIMLGNVGGELNPVNDEYFMRVIRKWFRVEANRQQFLEEFDAHISTGVPHCEQCRVAFISKDEFYKHVTGYTHARLNHNMFGGIFVRLARGNQDWDITM